MMEKLLQSIYEYLKSATCQYNVNPSFGSVITKNETYRIRSNKIMIQNVGNSVATLFDFWTFPPGSTLTMGAENDRALVHQDMTIKFSETPFNPQQPISHRIEIIKMDTVSADIAFSGSANRQISTP